MSPAGVGGAAALGEVYRRFAHGPDAAGSPLHQRVALAVGGSAVALRTLAAAPARGRRPAAVLAALHDLALAGRAPALASAYSAGDTAAAGVAAVDTLLRSPDAVLALVDRPVRTGTGRAAVLYPAVAEAARRAGAAAVGLVSVGCGAGLDLTLDRVGITYGGGPVLGDPGSPVQLTASVVGGRPVPARAVPEVVTRVGLDVDPVDATDAAQARWLRACLPPDRPAEAARLGAELALVAAARPQLVRGDLVEALAAAVALVPGDALPVVTTTWALSRLAPEGRLGWLRRLEGAAAGRVLAWVSVEGVGVAPAVPTLGDRRASGHSTIGVAVGDGAGVRAEAVGRCWSRGRLLSWLPAA